MPAKTPRPKWKTADTIRVGRGALALVTEHRAAVEPRLEAGLVDGLAADLPVLEDKAAAAIGAPEVLRAATRTQDAAAAAAHAFLVAAREAIARSGATEAQRAEFGLRLRVKPSSVPSVVAALDKFIEGATKHPAAARAASTLPSDVDTARALRAALTSADEVQETQKVARKAPVVDRNAAQLRVERAVEAIAAAGVLAHLHDPAVAALFRALRPASPKSKAARSAKAAKARAV